MYKCLCCGRETLDREPNDTYEVCGYCLWEHDGLQCDNPDYAGGANEYSLNQAKEFLKQGKDAAGYPLGSKWWECED